MADFKLPRRFERARAGELWQSDITSFVLRRQGRRVYLTVFLDDHSRFVVAWALATHQRTSLITEPLLEGIARFGKPREVLTDQGRQYFAWRGKSGFQKLLVKEGIAHVLSRPHLPETLGKRERLWKTVGDEFWDRTHCPCARNAPGSRGQSELEYVLDLSIEGPVPRVCQLSP